MRYLIAAGGTGGHINPGIALAREIRRRDPNADILFVGNKDKLESQLIPREGFAIRYLDVVGFKRKLSFDTFKSIYRMFQSYLQISRIIREYAPDAVIGTGGYVCGPVLLRAALKRIPTLVHESNALPGVTTRILAHFVDAIAIGFQEAKNRLKGKARIVYTGNPVRRELFETDREKARASFSLDKQDCFVVCYGGSLGSSTINKTIVDMMTKQAGKLGFRMLFATGQKNMDTVKAILPEKTDSDVAVVPYIYEMDKAISAADLMICRAGALTVGELCAVGVPSILVPSPYVAENHQEHNARSLETKGAAVVILEKQLDGAILHAQITRILTDRDLSRKMAANAAKMGTRRAAEDTIDLLEDLFRSYRNKKPTT